MKSSEELRWGSGGAPRGPGGTPCPWDNALGTSTHGRRVPRRADGKCRDTGPPGSDPALPPVRWQLPPNAAGGHTEAVCFHREGSTAVFREDLVKGLTPACRSSLPAVRSVLDRLICHEGSSLTRRPHRRLPCRGSSALQPSRRRHGQTGRMAAFRRGK